MFPINPLPPILLLPPPSLSSLVTVACGTGSVLLLLFLLEVNVHKQVLVVELLATCALANEKGVESWFTWYADAMSKDSLLL